MFEIGDGTSPRQDIASSSSGPEWTLGPITQLLSCALVPSPTGSLNRQKLEIREHDNESQRIASERKREGMRNRYEADVLFGQLLDILHYQQEFNPSTRFHALNTPTTIIYSRFAQGKLWCALCAYFHYYTGCETWPTLAPARGAKNRTVAAY